MGVVARITSPVSVQRRAGTAYSPTEMGDVIFDYFHELLGVERERRSTINMDSLGITPQNLSALEDEFTEDEVWAVINNMPADNTVSWQFVLQVLHALAGLDLPSLLHGLNTSAAKRAAWTADSDQTPLQLICR